MARRVIMCPKDATESREPAVSSLIVIDGRPFSFYL